MNSPKQILIVVSSLLRLKACPTLMTTARCAPEVTLPSLAVPNVKSAPPTPRHLKKVLHNALLAKPTSTRTLVQLNAYVVLVSRIVHNTRMTAIVNARVCSLH